MLTAISCTLPVALVSVGRAVTVLAGCCCLLSGGEVCLQAVLLACSHGRTGEPAVGGRQRKKPLTVLGVSVGRAEAQAVREVPDPCTVSLSWALC